MGSDIVIFTDQFVLKYLQTKQDAKARLIRWVLLLQEFNLQIKDKKGDKTLPRTYLNSCLEDPVEHFNGILETDSSNRRNPRSEPSLSITGLLV